MINTKLYTMAMLCIMLLTLGCISTQHLDTSTPVPRYAMALTAQTLQTSTLSDPYMPLTGLNMDKLLGHVVTVDITTLPAASTSPRAIGVILAIPVWKWRDDIKAYCSTQTITTPINVSGNTLTTATINLSTYHTRDVLLFEDWKGYKVTLKVDGIVIGSQGGGQPIVPQTHLDGFFNNCAP